MFNLAAMPTLNIKLFAVLRERLGRDRESLDYEGPLTVARLLELLRARHPDQARVLDQCKVAVNRVFAPADHEIRPDDEVALIPPIAGGSRCTG